MCLGAKKPLQVIAEVPQMPPVNFPILKTGACTLQLKHQLERRIVVGSRRFYSSRKGLAFSVVLVSPIGGRSKTTAPCGATPFNVYDSLNWDMS